MSATSLDLSPQVEFLLGQPEVIRRIRNIRAANRTPSLFSFDALLKSVYRGPLVQRDDEITAADVIELCRRMDDDWCGDLFATGEISLEVLEAILDVRLAHE